MGDFSCIYGDGQGGMCIAVALVELGHNYRGPVTEVQRELQQYIGGWRAYESSRLIDPIPDQYPRDQQVLTLLSLNTTPGTSASVHS